ncbi:ATP-binding cassette domain-containing protein [Daejeonella lutea]|uniref:ATP-binding cassette domain-containing protein n=1 Tax=Daejeonella lutea TaxID=572036 RepID=UPI001FECDDA9|nr:ATP-binding cassette domain-containing protein [Daejeonella lutea]
MNFNLRKGEHWALVGKSGSGKSILLDAFAGKSSFPNGRAKYPAIDHYIREAKTDDPLLNRFKLIAQVSSRHHFTNLSNTTDLYYQQRFNSMDSEDSQTVKQYLSAVRSYRPEGIWTLEHTAARLMLTPLLDKQLIKLSNGETKRLMIAAALVRNPILLLLDNPLTGLDISSRAGFDKLMQEIADSGISVIMSSSPNEIPECITHVAVVKDGFIEQVPKTLFKPEHHTRPETAVDIGELKDLLSTGTAQDYKIIVGMDGVTIRYGEKIILENISWRINQGERWMLGGPNGAGKSTLLSLINGDNPQAFANKIILFDKPKGKGESIWDIKKKIGFVSPELFQYFPVESSCMQIIESGFYDTMGLFRKSGEAKAAICLRWMRLLGIDQHSGTLLKSVPVSVQRLCLLARALVKNPPLLIFDEPCQGMDAEQQERFRNLVDEICKISAVSLIYVSHYESEKPSAVTKILRLDNGKVISI